MADLLDKLKRVLFPDGDMDHPHGADELDEVAKIVREELEAPKEEFNPMDALNRLDNISVGLVKRRPRAAYAISHEVAKLRGYLVGRPAPQMTMDEWMGSCGVEPPSQEIPDILADIKELADLVEPACAQSAQAKGDLLVRLVELKHALQNIPETMAKITRLEQAAWEHFQSNLEKSSEIDRIQKANNRLRGELAQVRQALHIDRQSSIQGILDTIGALKGQTQESAPDWLDKAKAHLEEIDKLTDHMLLLETSRAIRKNVRDSLKALNHDVSFTMTSPPLRAFLGDFEIEDTKGSVGVELTHEGVLKAVLTINGVESEHVLYDHSEFTAEDLLDKVKKWMKGLKTPNLDRADLADFLDMLVLDLEHLVSNDNPYAVGGKWAGYENWEKCAPTCSGWDIIHSDEHGFEIQRCDACNRFSSDDEAVAFVMDHLEESNDGLVRALAMLNTPNLFERKVSLEVMPRGPVLRQVGIDRFMVNRDKHRIWGIFFFPDGSKEEVVIRIFQKPIQKGDHLG